MATTMSVTIMRGRQKQTEEQISNKRRAKATSHILNILKQRATEDSKGHTI